MNPCMAAVIDKIAEDQDIIGLTNYTEDAIEEFLPLIRAAKEIERITELHSDIFAVRTLIEDVYEKKYGEKLIWKSKKSP